MQDNKLRISLGFCKNFVHYKGKTIFVSLFFLPFRPLEVLRQFIMICDLFTSFSMCQDGHSLSVTVPVLSVYSYILYSILSLSCF